MKCVNCKGRGLCGRPSCPVLQRFLEISSLPPLGKTLSGDSPPEVFVGRSGYPTVHAGPMIPLDHPDISATNAQGVGEIISLRSRMVRSKSLVGVADAMNPSKFLKAAQELAMSSLPVSTEVTFEKPPKGDLRFDGVLSPIGPSGTLQAMELTSNPSVPRKVDQLVNDNGATATNAIRELYRSKVGVDHITRLLSLGLVGKKRRLVPTRWSITASDDMLGKYLKGKVLDLPLIQDYRLYSGELLGNRFEIILTPNPLSFELIEIWLSGSVWAMDQKWIGSDSEGPTDKKGYSSLAGGYYAARLAALEGLSAIGRQAGVLALREISETYYAPLGVWVVRDAARKAMASAPRRFSSLKDALSAAELNMRTSFCEWQACSSIFKPVQTTLLSFY